MVIRRNRLSCQCGRLGPTALYQDHCSSCGPRGEMGSKSPEMISPSVKRFLIFDTGMYPKIPWSEHRRLEQLRHAPKDEL